MKSKIYEYEKYCKLAGIKDSTLRTFKASLQQHLQWIEDNNLDEITISKYDILSYRNELIKNYDYASGTINNKLAAISLYYKLLISHNNRNTNPVTKECRVKRQRGLIRNILDIESMGKLLSNIKLETPFDYLFKSVCEIMYSSGIRISECIILKLNSIDRLKGYIKIYESKENRDRTVPIGDIALKWIDEYINHGRASFVSDTDYLYPQAPYLIRKINSRLSKECENNGFNRITCHGFRHSCATHLLKNGANIKEVQDFLGHKKIYSTQYYTHIVKEDLKNILLDFHPRGLL